MGGADGEGGSGGNCDGAGDGADIVSADCGVSTGGLQKEYGKACVSDRSIETMGNGGTSNLRPRKSYAASQ